MRVAPAVGLSQEEEVELTRLVHSKLNCVRLFERAHIFLLAAQGLQNRQIAQELCIDGITAGRWLQHYIESGLAGIERDLPRGAPPAKVDVAHLVELTTQSKPEAGPRTGARARWA